MRVSEGKIAWSSLIQHAARPGGSLFDIITSGCMSSEADRLSHWSVSCVSIYAYIYCRYDDTQLASTPFAVSKFITTQLLHKDRRNNLRIEHHAGQAHMCTGMSCAVNNVNLSAKTCMYNAKAASNKNWISAFEQVLISYELETQRADQCHCYATLSQLSS